MKTSIFRSLDDKFVEAWYNLGGDFSYMFSKKLISYLSKTKFAGKKILDVYCGAGNFLAEMKKAGYDCTGTEGSNAFIKFNEQKYDDIKFIHTDALAKFGTKEKFDVITCIYDLVNYLETYGEWEEFFKAAHKQLNKGGKLVFDFNTTLRLSDWNTVVYEQAESMDYVQTVKSNVHGKTIINYVYYIKEKEKYYKTSAIYTETSFDTNRVKEALNKAGFKDVKFCDFDLNELSSPESRNKIHVVATK